MNDIFKKYPLPWKIVRVEIMDYYRVESSEYFQPLFWGGDLELLEYIVESANNSARLRITDADAPCKCGWLGGVGDCLPDVDGDGSLGCPECETVIEVIV